MPGLTQHFQLQKLTAGDSFAVNGQKYTSIDRDTIDRLLYLGAMGHHHNGETAADENPAAPPTLTVDQTQGYLPASTRVFYVYTYVDPSGAETAPSPISFVDLPTQTASPASPVTVATVGGGTLQPGGYFYSLSAYTGISNTNETPTSQPSYVTLVSTGANVMTLPSIPSGASGFNVYRRGPSEANYVYLASIDLTGPTPPATFTDDGSVAENTNRLAPLQNTTQSSNTVHVTLPGSPPSGWTWNLYRTIVGGQWANSLLASITALDPSGNLALVYSDLGFATNVGVPPVTSTLIGSPSKIDLATEVTGSLPPGLVAFFPVTVTFAFPGPVAALTGKSVWTCDFPAGQIVSARASLGRGSTPASSPVIIDVLKGTGVSPTYTTIFSGSGTQPQIPVGQQIGPLATPTVTALTEGDSLSVDIGQAGGGAGTDHDLTVTVTVIVSGAGLPSV